MANVEQMKNIVPFVTCDIAFGQNVCELMLGVDVPDLNFRIRLILSHDQCNSVVLDTCLIVGLWPLVIILITASLSSKTCNIALELEGFTFDET